MRRIFRRRGKPALEYLRDFFESTSIAFIDVAKLLMGVEHVFGALVPIGQARFRRCLEFGADRGEPMFPIG